ncbi:DUF6456 domain-containing protein [Rhizobium sp. TH135]|uniref:DUF6456 domain-containing protein n=1 Tax=Rhizobium sp. TH135 TaxID=2067451 RepID=UPI001FDEAEDC|nr:DUF6456 domain-containing protein [Rhizobium sp. TH135]
MIDKNSQINENHIETGNLAGSHTAGERGRAPTSPAMSSAGVLASTVTRTERKQIRQILRRALSGPLTPAAERHLQGEPPTADILARLASEGLLSPSSEGYNATAETAAWLRRDLCDVPDEAHATQHRAIEVETLVTPEGRQPVRRNLQESPLFPLLRLKEKDGRPFLSKEALAAGERLAADFDFAGLQPRITASWQPRLSARAKGAAPAAVELADNRIAARSRINRAVDAMGPELSGVALDICCFGKGLETVERERQWPARSAKLMLRAALLALARHYAPPPSNARPRHWGDDDFRARIG